ncbi:MAG: 4-phosphoerythronate dehydrogenase [Ignavibacteriae bacterium]|nr:4-phosphoerythronate dehydrogenase [Ignavibacteriota bacterium]
MTSRKPTIVVNRNTPHAVEVFSKIGNVAGLDTRAATREAVRDADILIARSETRVDASLLDGSAVKFVGTVTIGTDHIDLEYLKQHGIAFASAPGSNSNSVAEYIAAALLVWARRVGEPLRGKSLGIVGVGSVGSKVASVGKALGMEVLLNDPPLARTSGNSQYRSLEELMEADVITLHVPLTKNGQDATFHLFGKERIEKMKPGSVLINTSRGAVVETDALRAALAKKHLSAAVLDVWEGEPVIDADLLNRVFLGTPHIAGYSLDGKINALKMVYEQACKFLQIPMNWSLETTEGRDMQPIVIPGAETDEIAIIKYAVRQAYDIEVDDVALRESASMNASDRGTYFMKLRAEYRIRREFFHRTVEMSSAQSTIVPTLEGLGFRTLVREEAR